MSRYIWGYHLSADFANCDKRKISDADYIKEFTKALVETIQMVPYGEPQVVHFAAHDLSKAGYTLTQLIETSNICAHFVDITGEAYLDVFSCKQFSEDFVIDLFFEWFNPSNAHSSIVERGITPQDRLN
jgi:S-adenosylmethionine/arginine decarboxylase-like enzyme